MQAGTPLNKLFQQFLPVCGQNYIAQGFQKKAVTHLNHRCPVSGTYATLYYRLPAALFPKWAVTCHWHHPLSDFQRQDHANQMPSLLFPVDPSEASSARVHPQTLCLRNAKEEPLVHAHAVWTDPSAGWQCTTLQSFPKKNTWKHTQ